MKRTFSGVYATLILAVSFFAFAACSSDDSGEGPTIDKELPKFEDIIVFPGDTGTIEFNAYTTWTVSSDKPNWFKINPDHTTGKAGAQEIDYTVSEDGLSFNDNIATITLIIGKEDPIKFKVTRPSKARSMTLFSRTTNAETGQLEYKQVDSFALDYQANAASYVVNFGVVANFNWKVAVPAWISIEQNDMSGDYNEGAESDPSKLTYHWVSVDYSKATATDMSGKLAFTDRSGHGSAIDFAITCPGSNNYMMHSVIESITLTSKGAYLGNAPGGGTTTADSYDFPITAGNEGVKFFRIAKSADGWYGLPGNASNGWELIFEADWCSVTTTAKVLGPNVKEFTNKLKAEANASDPRYATLLAIPTVLAEGLTEENLVTEDGSAILEEYQKYLLCEVTQEGKVGLAYMYAKPEFMTGIEFGESSESELSELPEEYRSLISQTMNFKSVDKYTSQMSAVKVGGWDYKSDESHLNIAFIVDGAVTNTPPTWFMAEASGMSSSSYMSLVFKETPAWTTPRSVWVLFQEYEFVDNKDQFVGNIMTAKITQSNNNYDDEE